MYLIYFILSIKQFWKQINLVVCIQQKTIDNVLLFFIYLISFN